MDAGSQDLDLYSRLLCKHQKIEDLIVQLQQKQSRVKAKLDIQRVRTLDACHKRVRSRSPVVTTEDSCVHNKKQCNELQEVKQKNESSEHAIPQVESNFQQPNVTSQSFEKKSIVQPQVQQPNEGAVSCQKTTLQHEKNQKIKVERSEALRKDVAVQQVNDMNIPFAQLSGFSQAAALVKVGTSLVAGRGIFAAVDLPKNYILAKYCSKTKIGKPPRWGTYYGLVFGDNSEFYVDGLTPDGKIEEWSALINHSSAFNCKFDVHRNIVTTKKVKRGDEMFIDYGANYWKDALPELAQFNRLTLNAFFSHKPNDAQRRLIANVHSFVDVKAMWAKLEQKIQKEICKRQHRTQAKIERLILQNALFCKRCGVDDFGNQLQTNHAVSQSCDEDTDGEVDVVGDSPTVHAKMNKNFWNMFPENCSMDLYVLQTKSEKMRKFFLQKKNVWLKWSPLTCWNLKSSDLKRLSLQEDIPHSSIIVARNPVTNAWHSLYWCLPTIA